MRLGKLVTGFKLFGSRTGGEAKTSIPYYYQPTPAPLTYDAAVAVLDKKGYKVRRGQVDDLDEGRLDEITVKLRKSGISVRDFFVDVDDYNEYVANAGYRDAYRDYYCDNRPEKTLEHYLAFKALGLSAKDCFIDVASEHSPMAQIYGTLSGAECYTQDIQYQPGIVGNRIGGDACAMPVADGFATAAALTCSLEHFEADADIRLFDEMSRILKPGGKLVVAPLYMSTVDATQTDPLYSAATDIPFDKGCVVYCKEGWGNRHGRFYSPKSLTKRLIARHRARLRFDVFRLRNHGDLPQGIYLRLFMTCVRR